jgi:acetyltransferase-like isoleucine patch superfamily enzyme
MSVLLSGIRGRLVALVQRLAWLRACARVGARVVLHGRPEVVSGGWIEIGDAVVIWSQPWPARLFTGPDGSLFLEDRVEVGAGVTLVASGLVEIGAGTRIEPFAVISDVGTPEAPGDAAWAAPICVGRDVTIGKRAIVLPGTWIEDGAAVEAGSIVRGVVRAARAGEADEDRAAPRALAGEAALPLGAQP